jgi:hypothetical protein
MLKGSTRPARVIPCPQRALAPADLRCIVRSHARLGIGSDLRILRPPLLPKLAVPSSSSAGAAESVRPTGSVGRQINHLLALLPT